MFPATSAYRVRGKMLPEAPEEKAALQANKRGDDF
jgi:hypothetical protein